MNKSFFHFYLNLYKHCNSSLFNFLRSFSICDFVAEILKPITINFSKKIKLPYFYKTSALLSLGNINTGCRNGKYSTQQLSKSSVFGEDLWLIFLFVKTLLGCFDCSDFLEFLECMSSEVQLLLFYWLFF